MKRFIEGEERGQGTLLPEHLDDYVTEGYFAAVEEVKRITGQKKVNAVGYCIAGTTLSLTLALMKKRGDKSVNAATFFTTLTFLSKELSEIRNFHFFDLEIIFEV
jgi:poly(3-hydroxyalkanoate) synthetase